MNKKKSIIYDKNHNNNNNNEMNKYCSRSNKVFFSRISGYIFW